MNNVITFIVECIIYSKTVIFPVLHEKKCFLYFMHMVVFFLSFLVERSTNKWRRWKRHLKMLFYRCAVWHENSKYRFGEKNLQCACWLYTKLWMGDIKHSFYSAEFNSIVSSPTTEISWMAVMWENERCFHFDIYFLEYSFSSSEKKNRFFWRREYFVLHYKAFVMITERKSLFSRWNQYCFLFKSISWISLLIRNILYCLSRNYSSKLRWHSLTRTQCGMYPLESWYNKWMMLSLGFKILNKW